MLQIVLDCSNVEAPLWSRLMLEDSENAPNIHIMLSSSLTDTFQHVVFEN